MSIGKESSNWDAGVGEFVKRHKLDFLSNRLKATVENYAYNAYLQMAESHRVLKTGAEAVYVIGDSRLKGKIVPNHLAFVEAAEDLGFEVKQIKRRRIPERNRYLPTPTRSSSQLGQRMKQERVITVVKS